MRTIELQDRAMGGITPADRDRIVAQNLGLVHHVARQLYNSYSVQADFDELVSAGTMGLIGAAENFNPEVGVRFSTFAAPRIRGAIQDELRRMDHVPRSLRRKTREISAAREALSRVLGRAPETREIADYLGVDLDTLWRWETETESIGRVSLSESSSESGDKKFGAADRIAGETDEHIEDRINLSEESGFLRDALLHLKEQERTVLSLYYYEELKLSQIGQVLGLTESRVSQIRTKALSRLRTELEPLRAKVA